MVGENRRCGWGWGVKTENERVKRCGTSQVARYRNRSFGVDEFVMMVEGGEGDLKVKFG